MKTISRAKNSGFPALMFIILYLLLFIAWYAYSIDSAAMAQSTSVNQSDSKEGSDAQQAETKIVKPLGPADE